MSIRRRAVKITAAATLSLAALGTGFLSPAGAADGDPSQWGQSKAASVADDRSVAGDPSQWLSRHVNEYEGQKVNEYEGQHR